MEIIKVDKKERIDNGCFESQARVFYFFPLAKSYGRASRRCNTCFAASRRGTTDGWSSGSSCGWWWWRSSESVHDAFWREPPQWYERNVQLLWDGRNFQPCGSDGKGLCNKRERKWEEKRKTMNKEKGWQKKSDRKNKGDWKKQKDAEAATKKRFLAIFKLEYTELGFFVKWMIRKT